MPSLSVILLAFLTLTTLLLTATALRLRQILDPKRPRPKPSKSTTPKHILIVLGSGGHTAEMIAMLSRALLTPETSPSPSISRNIERDDWPSTSRRTYIVSSGDAISAQRAHEFEQTLSSSFTTSTNSSSNVPQEETRRYTIHTIPRARKIHQPLYTSPLSSLQCLFACLRVLLSTQPNPNLPSPSPSAQNSTPSSLPHAGEADLPDLILTNGPATATILILASLILRFFNIHSCETRGKMRTVYVESWARVKKLSLSGRICWFLVDRFVVQWPQLLEVHKGRGEFRGVLV